jgi:hypothetical protein
VCETGADVLEAADDVKRYRRVYFQQIRAQLQPHTAGG